jgi:AraC family transcriptional regulator
MRETIEEAVEKVIESMRENLGEPLTIDDMARTAMFSKFHFSRMFRQVTGISPGRFLSALRIQEAKRLLSSTSLTVADISNRVGYSSVGTFTSRFKNSVGVAPTTYRHAGGHDSTMPADDYRRIPGPRTATVRGNIYPASGGPDGLVFVGLFPNRIPQGLPVRYAVLRHPGQYVLTDVPPGTWHLLARSLAPVRGPADESADPAPAIGMQGPIIVRPDGASRSADVQLRPTRTFDPPVLLALLDASKAG